ncbi:hypothetical protein BJF90_16165 [Pseudonocardia sp. CNS-004]|nr:hypothetical protein BJF90_16165 [Pseudonocardia sp. CNS-004]
MLTREERRALRAIDEALTAEDPKLAELLREPPALRRSRLLPRLRWAVASVATFLILLAVVLSTASLLLAGMMTFLAIPAIHRWAGSSPAPGDT